MSTYSEINEHGYIVAARYTDTPPAPDNMNPSHRVILDVNPVYDSETQYLERVEPVLPEHTQVQYIVHDIVKTDEEWKNIVDRKRESYLFKTDWIMLPDSPFVNNTQALQEWKVYRQELRDMSTQPGYPSNVVWPTHPAGFDPQLTFDGIAR